ncbi:alcohol dehydrogenase catalytic domain-containing protein [Aquipuribacter nitratireducens]|uniref:Alcohol dehydrogenase catalytic domain-containing protein n=1 Tax=Aquipuribacter nitratireducens TaxID=650104 RepID=A0ABW0GLP0_9MICO
MRAVVVESFGVQPVVRDVDAPAPPPGGVVVAVEATGLCRSDWHAWAGHDPDVVLPHVPGHELAGTVAAVGDGVDGVAVGDRVTAPFVLACGSCAPCRAGEQQVCARQEQPGFTYWGSFAERVAVPRAAVNLVRLPDDVSTDAAALLGCRYATAFRTLVHVARLQAGETLAVHGCGGVGLAAVQVAVAGGARVVAVDPSPAARDLARSLGAERTVDPTGLAWTEVASAVRDSAGGPVDVSVDALGSEATCAASLAGLRPRGRHVQVGLLPAVLGDPAVPLRLVVGGELQLLGSHGMPAHAYPGLLALVAAGRLDPERAVTRTVDLDGAAAALAAMGDAPGSGVTLVRP